MISSVMSPSENDMRQMRHRQMIWSRMFIFLPGVKAFNQSDLGVGASWHMSFPIDVLDKTETF